MSQKSILLVAGIVVGFVGSLAIGVAFVVLGKVNAGATLVAILNGFGGVACGHIAVTQIDDLLRQRDDERWKMLRTSWLYRNAPLLSLALVRLVFGVGGHTVEVRYRSMFVAGLISAFTAVAFFLVCRLRYPGAFGS